MHSSSALTRDFYQRQSNNMRRFISQCDLEIRDHFQEFAFAVVGPRGAGKTALLKTMHYAFNLHNYCPIDKQTLAGTTLKRVQIKMGLKVNLQGGKEEEQHRIICGYQFEGEQINKNKSDDYPISLRRSLKTKKIAKIQNSLNALNSPISLKIISNQEIITAHKSLPQSPPRTLSPIKEDISRKYKQTANFMLNNTTCVPQGCGSCRIINPPQVRARLCLICFNILSEASHQQIMSIRFLREDLLERNIRCLMVLTHVDLIPGGDDDKSRVIDYEIRSWMKQLGWNEREDVICFQSYHQNIVERNHQVDFYSLKLLLRVVKQIENRTTKVQEKWR